jgi:hypothetical protein
MGSQQMVELLLAMREDMKAGKEQNEKILARMEAQREKMDAMHEDMKAEREQRKADQEQKKRMME